MRTFLQDLKYGLRMLAGKPGFTIVAILTLALGIGANTAIFSVVYGVVLKPLPFKEPGQLVRLYSQFPTFPGGGLRRFWISPPEYLDLKRDSQSWQTLDAWVNGGANLTGSTQPLRVTISYVTGGLLQSLAVSPIIGRSITAEDDVTGAPQVAVISEGLWKRAFGGDRSIIGRDTLLDGAKATIIGVMPESFEFPPGEANPPEMWVPLQIDPANPGNRGSHFLYLIGRMKPGVTVDIARAEMTQLVQHYGATKAPKTHAFSPDFHPLVMFPMKDEVISGIRPALLMLMGAVFFVLLIACVNVANLLLARAEVRQREIALRTALGATRGRLARQFVTEGALLSVGGGIAGALLAYGGLRLLVLTNAGLVPRVSEVTLNAKTLLFGLALCLITGVFFGLAPLAHVRSASLNDSLKASAGRSTASTAAHNFRRVLVVGEIALALVLLVGSGLMVRGFWKLLQVDPGFQSKGVLTMQLSLTQTDYPQLKDLSSFWERLQSKLTTLPGVKSADLVSGLPPTRRINANDTTIEGLAPGPKSPIQNVDYWEGVTPGYFSTMGVRLLQGRLLEASDGAEAPPVVVINEAMAHHFYGNDNPLGRRIKLPSGSNNDPWTTIVGVVADVKNAGIDQPAGTELFVPYSQQQAISSFLRNFSVVIKTTGDPESLARSAEEAIHSLDPSLPIANMRTMDEVVARSESRPRFLTMLLGLFSALALILAAVGIYGLMAYSVTQRTNEIGIRMALGARPGDVKKMVLIHGMSLTGAGIVIGLGAAYGLTRLMASLLFGVTATDPATFAVIAVVLALAAMGACFIPAHRATKVDPMIALRYE